MPKNKNPITVDFKVCIIEEQKPLKTHGVVRREVKSGRNVLYISRKVTSVAEEEFAPLHKIMKIHRITPRTEQGSISQLNDHSLYCDIDNFLNYNNNTLITILNFEMFVKWLLFDRAFALLQRVLKLTRMYPDCAVILVIDPGFYTEEQLKAIESVADKIIPPTNPIEVGSKLDKINTKLMAIYHELWRKYRAGETIGIPISDETAERIERIYKARMELHTKEEKEEEDEEPNPYETGELASLPWGGCSEK